MPSEQLPGVTKFKVAASEDGRATGFKLATADGEEHGFALSAMDLGNFVGQILMEMKRAAAENMPSDLPEKIRTAPILATSVSVGAHPHDPAVTMLGVHIGDVPLSFQVSTTDMMEMAKRLLANAEPGERPQN